MPCMCDLQISVDELESSVSVKISKEAVMSINSPQSLFTPVNGKVETKVYIAGLPERADTIKPVSSLPTITRRQIRPGPASSWLWFPRHPLDQPSSWRLHPGMESDEPGGIKGQGGHPGAKEQTVFCVCGKGVLFQRNGISELQHWLQWVSSANLYQSDNHIKMKCTSNVGCSHWS